MALRFGEFEIDAGRTELRRRGQPVRVQPRVFETILYLAARAGRLVTREELASGPWRGMTVGDAAIARAIKEARAALGDTGDAPSTIVTVRGVGFRFDAEVFEDDGESRAPANGSQRRSRVFAGRERELSELELAWSEARAGQGNLVLVAGVPGIGKSALVERFFGNVSAEGGDVHWGRCLEAQGTPPHWPWPELLRSYLERHGAAQLNSLVQGELAEVALIAPALARDAVGTPNELAEGPYSAFRARDAVARFFRRAAERGPLALVLEDIHLADGAALDLLEHLQRSIAASRLLVVATCRIEEAREKKPLRTLLEGALPHTRTLELEGLVKSDVARWLEHAGGGVDARELSERVTRSTDGHPLLISNLLCSLPPGFAVEELEQALARELSIPENLSESFRRRLEHLDAGALELVRTASVLGEEPWLPVLAELLQAAPATLGASQDRALRAGILERRETGRLRFTHALLREHLYRELDPARRLNLHARAAAAFSARLQDHPELVIEAAHHAMAASPSIKIDETVELLVEAANWARRRRAFGLAAEHLRWALQTLDLGDPNPRPRTDLLLALARSLHLAGHMEDSVRTYRELYELSSANGYHDRMADALTGEFDIRVEATIPDDEYQRRLREALALLKAHEAHYARLLALRAVVTPFVEGANVRGAWLDDAIRIGRKTEDATARLTTLHAASRVEFLDAGLAGLELAEEFKDLARSTGDAARLMDAIVWRSDCLLRLGRGEEFALEVRELDQLGETIGCGQFAYFQSLYASCRKLMNGDLEGAESAARSAWNIGLPAVGILADCQLAGQLLLIAVELVGTERKRLLHEAVEKSDAVLARVPAFETFRLLFVSAYLETGRREAAIELLRSVRARGSTLQRDRNWLLSTSALVDTAIAEGDRAAARDLRTALAPHDGLQVSSAFGIGLRGPVRYWLGRLDLMLGDDAVPSFERAVIESERACSRSFKAWSELGLVEALVKRAGAHDLVRARSLRESVRRTATELELPRLLGAAEGRVPFLSA